MGINHYQLIPGSSNIQKKIQRLLRMFYLIILYYRCTSYATVIYIDALHVSIYTTQIELKENLKDNSRFKLSWIGLMT